MLLASLVLAGLLAAPPFGPSPAAQALAAGDLDAALRLPAGSPDEAAYIRARVALAHGRVDEAATQLARIDPESRRARELAWLVAHARHDASAIAAAAARFCASSDVTGRSCVDAELYRSDLPPARVTLAGDSEVPLMAGAPFPVVVGDVGPQRAALVVDTGASQTVISRKLADRLGLKRTGARFPVGVAAGGAKVDARLAILPELQVGQAKVVNLPVLVMDVPELDAMNVSAILSPQQAFDGLVVTLDFPRGRLSLKRAVDAGSLEGAAVVPYLRVGFEMAVQASVGAARHALFVVDTGMSWSYALARSYAAALGLAPDGPSATVQGAGAAASAPLIGAHPVRLGPLTLEPTMAGVLTEASRPASIQIAGFLGNGLWDKGALTIDTVGRRLLLRLSGHDAPPPPTP